MKLLTIIAAIDLRNGIGKNNTIPWNAPNDLKQFKKNTLMTTDKNKKNAVVMGYNTWKSLPKKPLPNRLNVIISNKYSCDITNTDDIHVYNSLNEALDNLNKNDIIENIFVIGGEKIFTETIIHSQCKYLLLTKLYVTHSCDKFFPQIPENFTLITPNKLVSESNEQLCINKFKLIDNNADTYMVQNLWVNENCNNTEEIYGKYLCNKNIEKIKNDKIHNNLDEKQYINYVNSILLEGRWKFDRTQIGTLSIFGDVHMKFNLRNKTLPLLTTKFVPIKSVVEELLFFLQGKTDTKELEKKNVNIWKGNTSREYLDSIGLNKYKEGEAGPFYGWQWRNFGKPYNIKSDEYYCDQIKECINLIKTNPSSRRIIISAWNPNQIKEMCLPPCHVLYNFDVNIERKELSCLLYQRSGDMGLGVPFNIASASILTHIIAELCDLTAASFIHVIGDAHVYQNHISPLIKQLEREPFTFPKIKFNRNIKDVDIDELVSSDISIENYNYHKKIAMQLAV